MDLKRIAKDTAQVLTSYLTYQAVRTVLAQLKETNLPRFYWFHEFSSRDRLQDGEAFIQDLFQEQPELALRVMIVRQHLAEEVTEFLPEMVTTNIQQSNMEHRKKHLERITQMTSEELAASADKGSNLDTSKESKPTDSERPEPESSEPESLD
ncbi:MAG: chaperonin family protein RbcX [Phormidesmis sp.]